MLWLADSPKRGKAASSTAEEVLRQSQLFLESDATLDLNNEAFRIWIVFHLRNAVSQSASYHGSEDYPTSLESVQGQSEPETGIFTADLIP